MMNYNDRLIISGHLDTCLENLLRTAFNIFCRELNLAHKVYASLVFCSAEDMISINKKYRGSNSSTDVISFPATDAAFSTQEPNDYDVYLGEILIDTNYIKLHANQNDSKKEILHAFIHGLLHILGFNHLNVEQIEEMITLEKNLNSKIEGMFVSE